jgi:hypothetical protein
MAIDIRATVTCSLGTLISGSISDDYLQGSGLVKTKGSCEISGLITPAVGTVVTFDYVKGGVTRAIPRKLRVLSSFADPFRRTTKVELGCKLTYLSDLKEAINWDAFDDPENAGLTEADAEIITLPIRASSVMSKCLTELGITASSSPLTNRFSVAEFDFGPGYVQVLGDLLVSESYFGYLDFNEVLQVVSLDQAGGTGPVFTSADIVDLGPIGVGQLPGEAVTVSYSTLKLNGDTINEDALLDWETTESSSTSKVVISYTDGAGAQAFREFNTLEATLESTNYSPIETPTGEILNKVVSRLTQLETSSVSVLGGLPSDYLNNGISFNSEQITKTTSEFFYYDAYGNEFLRIKDTTGSIGFFLGTLGIAFAFAADDYYNPVLTTSVALEYEIVRTETIGNYQKVATEIYGPWVETLSGQQAVATGGQGIASAADVTAFVNEFLPTSGGLGNRGLFLLSSSVRTERRTEGQAAPTTADIINAANANGEANPDNGWRTESSAELELALGSATAQRRIEFSLPYAPDDRFVKSGGSPASYFAVASDAPEKANRYGRVQNRLLLGNRSGVNLQVAPEKLPVAPFAPLYLKADGLTALYRANGNQWAFDSNGIVCSTDALFWAAVSGTGTFWFPVAPGVTTLPAEPAIVDGEMNATTIVLPYNETAVYESRLRLGNVVTKFDYALELLTEVPVFVVKTGVTISKAISGGTGSFDLTGQNVTLRRPLRALNAESGAFDLSGESAVLRPPVIIADSGAYSLVGQSAQLTRPGGDPYWNEVKLLLHMDGANDSTVFVDSSPVARTMSVSGNTRISTAQSKFGGASGFWDSFSDILSTADSEDWDVGGGAFTIEGWIWFPSISYTTRPLIAQNSTSSSGFAWQVLADSSQFRFHYSLDGSNIQQLNVFFSDIPAATWVHFAICRSGNNLYWFKDGILLQTSTLTGVIFNSSAVLNIGARTGSTASWSGHIDEMRFTRAARYTSSFTVQTQPFPEYAVTV